MKFCIEINEFVEKLTFHFEFLSMSHMQACFPLIALADMLCPVSSDPSLPLVSSNHGGMVLPVCSAGQGAVSLHRGGEGLDVRSFSLQDLHPGCWCR